MLPTMNYQRTRRRQGFTLVELLVAVAIFIILTTLTIATVNLNLGSERISASARQVQSMLEGARSRAFKLQRPVGVRFLLDSNHPSEVTGMIYVSSVDSSRGGGVQKGRLRFVDLNNGAGAIRPGIQQLNLVSSLSWKELHDLQLLRAGVKIRIPAETGPWYTISSNNFLTLADSVMELTEAPQDVTQYGFLSQDFKNNTGMIYDYEIDLSTVMIPLANEEPVQLPPGVVIDLHPGRIVSAPHTVYPPSSKVPRNWYINRWIDGYVYVEGSWVAAQTSNGLKVYRASNSGTSGTAEPNWSSAANNGNTLNDNGIIWVCYPVPLLDVVFSPQGTVMGAASAEGVLHFTLAETRDTRVVLDDGTVGLRAWDTTDRNSDGGPDHLGSFRIITIFPASGAIGVSDIDQTPSAGNPNVAADIFNFALQGMEAK